MRIKININFKIGRIVKYLILSDLFLLFGWGIITPIFPVFIIDHIVGATLFTLGAVAAVYWILKSIVQIPVANYLDGGHIAGEKHEFMVLIIGLLLAGFSALAFAVTKTVLELYLVQIVHAIGFGMYIPSWSSIFSRHLDKDRISFDWSLDSTVAGISSGISGLIAGAVAATWGFTAIFIAGGVFSLGAAMVIMAAPQIVLPRPSPPVPGETKVKTPDASNV